MDSNWIFDHPNSQASTPSGNINHPSSNAQTPIDHQSNHEFTPSQSHAFLNFDSPSNNSDFNPSNPNNNQNQSHTILNSVSSESHHQFNNEINSSLKNSNDSNHLHEWAQLPDFNDLDMNFFQNQHNNQQNNDHDQHTQQQSQAQQQTNGHHSIPPTPQSFDVTNYANSSNSSFIQNFQSPQLDSNPSSIQNQTSIRPDVVFTPLVSPAVTPLESMINQNQKHNGIGINTNGSNNNNFFSPLTSPALEAKSPMKYRKNSNSNSPDENQSNQTSSTATTKKKYKRKTPGNTPIVGPTIPGRIAKQSPIIKAKRSSSYVSSIHHHHHHQFQQPGGSSTSQSNTPLATTPTSGEYEMTPLPDPSVDQSINGSMAPPSSTNTTNSNTTTSNSIPTVTRRRSKKDSISSNGSGSNQPATPATLMNFKLESSNSPVILPSNGHQKSFSISQQQNGSISTHQQPQLSSHQRRPSEDSDTKKASHKLAEQGRRNRMNQAIMELGDLIPEQLQQTISIPSKATTVELATRYILELKEENRRLKEVLLVENASPNSITTFHDTISNEIPKELGRWSFELKIFKINNSTAQSSQSNFLYNLALSHEPHKAITLVNKSAIISNNDISKELIDSGCSNISIDSLDHIIQTKLQSLWLLRQTLKGENGNSYELLDGSLVLRTINVFLHGSFKAFLIEIEYKGKGDGLQKIKQFTEELNIPQGRLCTGMLNDKPSYLGDLSLQYTEALRF
ncbi:Mediator of RNA polymerase II transcription subunit 20 [Wickerhamomyces ciferrii]|uniref:Mediator of RNA polymerase II transcription subunit 20 n=1 Tax=Wickerhamomyces ciferrii (strain ATCC 14091 / BCRC 22168 / CBS 111 / JCM 3599 / NBRC 0793 / NRRL Y-1031 F-60-10) TaxID=1206466 RepID=K0KBC7_WICCF|nr:Mediator of RNA polymerase II transcription subunit 20 [Wickerhamomyces ciferrii]CCH42310.1 Mediator of RNA polymerase II transcription subunit 20 [Wickerhamomyces ciferrii]